MIAHDSVFIKSSSNHQVWLFPTNTQTLYMLYTGTDVSNSDMGTCKYPHNI